MKPNQLFHLAQKAFVEKNGQVLILDHELGIDFPGGRVQEGETDFTEELKREVREEAGIEIEVGLPFITWYTIDEKTGIPNAVVGYKCKYISGEITISHEHHGFQWVDKHTYKQLNNKDDFFPPLEQYFKNN